LIEKVPSSFVEVPDPEELTTTEAPETGSPVFESVTFPVTVCCACKKQVTMMATNVRICFLVGFISSI
jgi:hypothetical protein